MSKAISSELIQSVKKEEEAANKAFLELLLIRSRITLEEREELEEIIVDFYHQNSHLITLTNQEIYEKVLGNKLICHLACSMMRVNGNKNSQRSSKGKHPQRSNPHCSDP